MGLHVVEKTFICCDWCGKNEYIECTGDAAVKEARKIGYEVIISKVKSTFFYSNNPEYNVLCKYCH